MLEKMGLDVLRFQDSVLGLPRPDRPQMLGTDRLTYTCDHVNEELQELLEARTIEDQADALLDITYVALGRLLEMGVPVTSWDEVQRANMQRRGVGRTARSEYDAIKPDGWTPPDLHMYCTITPDEMALVRLMRERLHAPGCRIGQTPPQPCNCDGWPVLEPKGLTRAAAGVRPHPKVLILGYGRHGKDTVAEMLRDRYGLSFMSSSRICAESVCLPYMRERGFSYADAEECFEDRHSGDNRKHWYDAIVAFNRPDASSLGRRLFEANDVYVGLRAAREFHAVKAAGLYDLCVWVDASGRGLPPEDRSSCTVEPWMADHVLDNGGDLDELRLNLDRLMKSHFNMEPSE